MRLSQTLIRTWCAGCLLVVLSVPAWAQDEPPARSYSSMLNVDALVDNYARLLARKYNLTEEQDDFTQEFLRAKTEQFLDQHRDEMYGLIDRMFEVRAGGDITQEEMMRWGQQAIPLFQDAKQLIVQGNDEWREILTEDQKQIHDADLDQMFESFATTEDQLDRIVSGEMTVEEFRHPNRPNRTPRTRVQPEREVNRTPVAEAPRPGQTRQPTGPASRVPARSSRQEAARRLREIRAGQQGKRTPAKRATRERPAPMRGRAAKAVKGSENFEGEWDKYVREFIERYELNEAQAQRAMSILKDCKEQASSYMAKRRTTLRAIDTRLEMLEKDKQGADKDQGQRIGQETSKLREQRGKLLEPIGRIFEQRLKPRLERLPTRAQRAAAEKAGRNRGGDDEQVTRLRKPIPAEEIQEDEEEEQVEEDYEEPGDEN